MAYRGWAEVEAKSKWESASRLLDAAQATGDKGVIALADAAFLKANAEYEVERQRHREYALAGECRCPMHLDMMDRVDAVRDLLWQEMVLDPSGFDFGLGYEVVLEKVKALLVEQGYERIGKVWD